MSNGVELRYAFKKATTWNTAVACGAGNGFLGLDLSLKADTTNIIDDSRGQLFSTDSSAAEVKCDAEVPAYLRYNDATVLSMLAMIMGTAGVPVTHASGTTSKDHVLKVANSTAGLFGTLCGMLGTLGVEECTSWKPSKAIIKGSTGKPLEIIISGPGIDVTVASAVNTTATMANVTVLERSNRAYMGQTEIRMNAQSGGALSGSDKIGPSSFELTIERAMTGVYGSYSSTDTSPRDLIDEPTGDGMFTVSLKLQFPRTSSLAARTAMKNKTAQKCEIIITGPIIETTIPYQIKIQLPNVMPKAYENPYAAGIIQNSREYDVLGCTTAPTGMTGITDPLWINITNTIATNLLA